MKPFNLEEALAGKPVVTRAGEKVVKILHLADLPIEKKVLAVVYRPIAQCNVEYFFNEKGEYYHGAPSMVDLFMDSSKKEGWINLYKHQLESNSNTSSGLSVRAFNTVHKTKEDADVHSKSFIDRIGCAHIEWEE